MKISNKGLSKKQNIVVIGGGNGSAISLLALKPLKGMCTIASINTTADSGGSSGILRELLHTIPTGDIMRAVLALSQYDFQTLRAIFYETRFENLGKLNRHNIGNLFIALGAQFSGNVIESIRALEQAIKCVGHVYPATLDNVQLCAELSNGQIVKGEAAIDVPTYERSLRIQRVWLEPQGRAYPESAKFLRNADIIILGPGHLYTSIIPTLLPSGIKEAIAASKAELIFTPPHFYTLENETGPETLSELVTELEMYLPRALDRIIYDDYVPRTEAEQNIYRIKRWKPFLKDSEKLPQQKLMRVSLHKPGSGMLSEKLAEAFRSILQKRYVPQISGIEKVKIRTNFHNRR